MINFVKIQKLNFTASTSVITQLKSLFARFDTSAEMVTDNGPQVASIEMKEFLDSYGFQHITIGPHYLQANGLAEQL